MANIPSIATGQVIQNQGIAPDHFLLTLRLPPYFVKPVPGQFVMVRDAEREEPLLPRPISVYSYQRREDHALLGLLCRVAGRGTSLFARLQPGAMMTALGPLGRGFRIDPDVRRILLVAGGVGVAPLAFLLQEGPVTMPNFGQPEITAYLGAGTAELLAGLNLFPPFCDLKTATDDGSCGYRGTIIDRLAVNLGEYDSGNTLLLACGPSAMIRSLASLIRNTDIRCQVSLEERMACGVGACLGCAVAVREGEGRMAYQRVCKEGPVFDIRELV